MMMMIMTIMTGVKEKPQDRATKRSRARQGKEGNQIGAEDSYEEGFLAHGDHIMILIRIMIMMFALFPNEHSVIYQREEHSRVLYQRP